MEPLLLSRRSRGRRPGVRLAMTAHAHRMLLRRAFFSLASGAIMACLPSCSAADEAPGTKVEHPVEHSRAPAAAASSAKVAPGPPSPETGPSPPNEAGSNDYPFPRPLSKNVPNQSCANDDECGDGFCDRGQCAAIWTRKHPYGQRCEGKDPCPGVCLDGRCRSCVSDDECRVKLGSPAVMCNQASTKGFPAFPGRQCGHLAPKALLP